MMVQGNEILYNTQVKDYIHVDLHNTLHLQFYSLFSSNLKQILHRRIP